MKILKSIFKIISTVVAAHAGNWIGGQIRFQLTGKPVQTIRFQYIATDGQKISNYPVATKLYPTLLLSSVGKPRWFFALLGGILIGFLMDDRFETMWLERFVEPIFIDRVSGVDLNKTGEITIE